MASSTPWISMEYDDAHHALEIHERQDAFQMACDTGHLPTDGCPMTVALIGQQKKAGILRELFLVRQSRPATLQTHGQMHLWTQPTMQTDQPPLLFFDCELHANQRDPGAWPSTGPHRTRRMNLDPASTCLGAEAVRRQSLAFHLYTQMLLPVTALVCIVADDFYGLGNTAAVVAEWIITNEAPSMPPAALPRLLVLSLAPFPPKSDTIANLVAMHLITKWKPTMTKDEALAHIARFFSALLPGQINGSSPNRVLDFLKLVKSEATMAYQARASHRSLFSQAHMEALLTESLDHVVSGSLRAPSPVISSRRHCPVSVEFANCLGEVLRKIPSGIVLGLWLVPLVASALLLDSCPPGCHFFAPDLVFDTLYRDACHAAVSEYTIHASIHESFLAGIREGFVHLYTILEASPHKTTAAALHARQLKALRAHLRKLRNNRACLCCLMRTPEKVLTCGHALCDVCIKIYAVKSPTEQYTYQLPACVLCGNACSTTQQRFRFIPPTAGIRILSLDGGGVKGIIPLMFLAHLEARFGALDCPLRSLFDLVCGTSAGGLIILGIFVKQWSLAETINQFEALSEKVFKRRGHGLHDLVLSYLADCRYDSSLIEAAFQSAFGTKARLFNPVANDTKVAVTTTAAQDSAPYLLSNYNGGLRSPNSTYSILRADDPQDEVSVSDAARCTSAAPYYFKPKVLSKLGTFQDGGMRYNNPLSVALWESAFLWPGRGQPDFALSIGSGMPAAPASVTSRKITSPVRDRFIPRLLRSLMLSMDGEASWNDLYRSLPKSSRDRYFRLNLPLIRAEPSLDDVSSIPWLKAAAAHYLAEKKSFDDLEDAIWASMFYFKLDGLPKWEDGVYRCSGHIFCRVDMSLKGRGHLYQILRASKAFFTANGCPYPCIDDGVPRCVPLFKKKVLIEASDRASQIQIQINGITKQPRPISGLPRTVDDLVESQGLYAPFGRSDHAIAEKALPPLPPSRKRKMPAGPSA